MLYEELKSIEKLLEGNEYFSSGVSYCLGIDKIDSSHSLELSLRQILVNELGIDSLEKNIVFTHINHPQIEMKKMCSKWHFDEDINEKIINMIDDNTKVYKFCDDNEFISKGCLFSIFRVLKKYDEWVLMEFYLVD